ncbi:MAG: hypothetical protein AAFV53_01090 [Myxococcota bacterium]
MKDEWWSNATSGHDLNTLRQGLQQGMLNEQDEYGHTALILASCWGWLPGV